MSRKLNIEELAKQKLEHLEAQVPASAWAGVQAKLAVAQATATASATLSSGFVAGLVGGLATIASLVGTMNVVNTFNQSSRISIVEEKSINTTQSTASSAAKADAAQPGNKQIDKNQKQAEVIDKEQVATSAAAWKQTPNMKIAEEHQSFDEYANATSELNEPKDKEQYKEHVTTVDDAVSLSYGSSILADPVAGEAPLLVKFNVKDVVRARWSFGDGSPSVEEIAIEHQYEKSGTYNVTLIAEHSSGKIYQDQITVKVADSQKENVRQQQESLDLTIPNVFSPNSDGINDFFSIQMKDQRSFSIKIYNSAGKLVFESTQPDFKWNGTEKDGTSCPSGTYFYQIKVVSLDESVHAPKGSITILR